MRAEDDFDWELTDVQIAELYERAERLTAPNARAETRDKLFSLLFQERLAYRIVEAIDRLAKKGDER